MNLELFIANRLKKGQLSGSKWSAPVVKVSTLAVILGMVVMIIAISISAGFKKEIRNKIVGFGAHIQVINYDFNMSYEASPIHENSHMVEAIKVHPNIEHVQRFAFKPGLVKTKENMQGVILKGVGSDFNWNFFKDILVEGEVPSYSENEKSNEILISKQLSNILNIGVGDKVNMFFIQEQIRARSFKVKGIYNSHFPEFDNLYVVGDLHHVQALSNWDSTQIAGYEIALKDYSQLEENWNDINIITSGFIAPDGALLRAKTIEQWQPQIFGWLNLLDMNLVVILILIIAVAGFSMITGLLILILERTNMIGILKSLGSPNASIRKVFVYLALFIVGRGMLWGNIIGLSICLLQKYFSIFKLDPENYYLEVVPVDINFVPILLLNLLVMTVLAIMLIAPSYIVARISPIKAIRFE